MLLVEVGRIELPCRQCFLSRFTLFFYLLNPQQLLIINLPFDKFNCSIITSSGFKYKFFDPSLYHFLPYALLFLFLCISLHSAMEIQLSGMSVFLNCLREDTSFEDFYTHQTVPNAGFFSPMRFRPASFCRIFTNSSLGLNFANPCHAT